MCQEHDTGDIDVKIPWTNSRAPTAPWPTGVNEMVTGHIASRKRPWPASPSSPKATSMRRWNGFPARKPLSTTPSSGCEPTSRVSSRRCTACRRSTIRRHRRRHPRRQVRRRLPHHGPGRQRHGDGPHRVKKKAMACIAEFGQGNFDAPWRNSRARKSSSTKPSRRCGIT